ncbi:MAG TPA: AraC family transcriptional regulator ligand-binding domain-containing protein [Alphaproteobacteria bacterium]|nr:AraC family transcriptional regulator ligand-binding domain-containing protein [Alphaproteobacteria bacterium]
MTKHISRPAPKYPSASLARALLAVVEDIGGDVSAILERAGVASSRANWRKTAGRVQLTQDQFIAIYRECIGILDRYARINTGLLPLSSDEFRMLCHCVITCNTLSAAIARASAFSAMIEHRAGQISLHVSGRQAEFRMGSLRAKHDASAFLSDVTGLSAYHRLFGWLIGEDIEPLTIEVCYVQFIDDEAIAQLLPNQIVYGAPCDALKFPARYLEYPVVRTPLELGDFSRNFPFDLSTVQSRQTQISERVRHIFNTALVQRTPLPTAPELATQFSIGLTTLKRRLAEEGSSLKAIKEQCRHEMALTLLSDERLSFGEIAARVGLSDSTAFCRAFNTWTGKSPSRYRRELNRFPGEGTICHRCAG